MLGFNELNYHSQQAVEYNDNRPSGVRYEGIPRTVIFSTVRSSIPAQPAPIDVLEIVNYDTAAVTFQVRVQSKYLAMTQGTTFTFNLPPGITQELLASGEYQFSGFRTANELNQILSYAIKVPMDWPTYDNWYFENEISYYDSASATTKTITWILGDPLFMPTAFITSASAMAAAGIVGAPLAAAMATAFNFVFIPEWAKTFSAHAESEFNVADVVVSDIGPFQSEVALVALGMSALEVTAQAFPLATVACIANGESGKEAFAIEPAVAVATFAPTGNALFNAEAQPLLSTAVLSATAGVGQNSATAPIGSVYAEDTIQTLDQVFGAPGLVIDSWRPEETYDFRITELQSSLPYVAEPKRVTHSALDTSFNARTADHDPFTGRTVVACQNKNAYSDDNGATWTSYEHAFGTPLDLFFNRYRDEWVMTVGSVIYRSTDGVTFTQWYDHGSTSGQRRIAYSPVLNKYVVARADSVWIFDADTAPVAVTVTSGITINDIAYSAELNTLIVVGANGVIYTSVDAQSWTQRTSGTTNTLNGVTWAGTQFVVVGANEVVRRSATGVTWTAASSVPVGTGWHKVAYHAASNTLMANAAAIFSGQRVMYSTDNGNTWTQLPLNTAMLDIKATQTGFILPSTTGGERAFSYNAVITPQFTNNYPRVIGTAAQIQTALDTYNFLAATDQISTVSMRTRLTHAIARDRVYLNTTLNIPGSTEANISQPSPSTTTYYDDRVTAIGQNWLYQGLDITDTADGNQYEMTIQATAANPGTFTVDNVPAGSQVVLSGTRASIRAALATIKFVENSTVPTRTQAIQISTRSTISNRTYPAVNYSMVGQPAFTMGLTTPVPYSEDTEFILGTRLKDKGFKALAASSNYNIVITFDEMPRELKYGVYPAGDSVLGSMVGNTYTLTGVLAANVEAELEKIQITPPWNKTGTWPITVAIQSIPSGRVYAQTYNFDGLRMPEVYFGYPDRIYNERNGVSLVDLRQNADWQLLRTETHQYRLEVDLVYPSGSLYAWPTAGAALTGTQTYTGPVPNGNDRTSSYYTWLGSMQYQTETSEYQEVRIRTYQVNAPGGDRLVDTSILKVNGQVPAEEPLLIVSHSNTPSDGKYTRQALVWRGTDLLPPTVVGEPALTRATYDKPNNAICAAITNGPLVLGQRTAKYIMIGNARYELNPQGVLQVDSLVTPTPLDASPKFVGMPDFAPADASWQDYVGVGNILYVATPGSIRAYDMSQDWSQPVLLGSVSFTVLGSQKGVSIAAGPNHRVAVGQTGGSNWGSAVVRVYQFDINTNSFTLINNYTSGTTDAYISGQLDKIPMAFSRNGNSLAFLTGNTSPNKRLRIVSDSTNVTSGSVAYDLHRSRLAYGVSTTGTPVIYAIQSGWGVRAINSSTSSTLGFFTNNKVISVHQPVGTSKVYFGTNDNHILIYEFDGTTFNLLSDQVVSVTPEYITSSPI